MTSLKTIQQRPKLEIQPTKQDKIYEVIALSLLLAGIAYTLWGWARLPETVSTHFNLHGRADAQGSKDTVFFLVAAAVGLYSLLTVFGRYPRVYNYPIPINEHNAERQYSMASTMVRLLKGEVMLLFAFLEFAFIDSATHKQMTVLPMALVGLSVFTILLTVATYYLKSIKDESEL